MEKVLKPQGQSHCAPRSFCCKQKSKSKAKSLFYILLKAFSICQYKIMKNQNATIFTVYLTLENKLFTIL